MNITYKEIVETMDRNVFNQLREDYISEFIPRDFTIDTVFDCIEMEACCLANRLTAGTLPVYVDGVRTSYNDLIRLCEKAVNVFYMMTKVKDMGD